MKHFCRNKVEAKLGVVTMYGKAGNAAELNLATKLANDVYGVKGMKNRMTIEQSESRTKETV